MLFHRPKISKAFVTPEQKATVFPHLAVRRTPVITQSSLGDCSAPEAPRPCSAAPGKQEAGGGTLPSPTHHRPWQMETDQTHIWEFTDLPAQRCSLCSLSATGCQTDSKL